MLQLKFETVDCLYYNRISGKGQEAKRKSFTEIFYGANGFENKIRWSFLIRWALFLNFVELY